MTSIITEIREPASFNLRFSNQEVHATIIKHPVFSNGLNVFTLKQLIEIYWCAVCHTTALNEAHFHDCLHEIIGDFAERYTPDGYIRPEESFVYIAILMQAWRTTCDDIKGQFKLNNYVIRDHLDVCYIDNMTVMLSNAPGAGIGL